MRECVLFKSVFGEFAFNLGVAAAGAVGVAAAAATAATAAIGAAAVAAAPVLAVGAAIGGIYSLFHD